MFFVNTKQCGDMEVWVMYKVVLKGVLMIRPTLKMGSGKGGHFCSGGFLLVPVITFSTKIMIYHLQRSIKNRCV